MFVDEYSYKNTVALFVRIELTEKLYLKVALLGTTEVYPALIVDVMLHFLARLDEVQKSLCTTPGVGVGVSVHIYVKVFSMVYIFQIT